MGRVADALQNVVRLAQDSIERGAREGGLHHTDFVCIGLLFDARRPLSPKEIIAFLGISSGSGTALLDRLERQGYIKRLPNPEDRRGVLIALDKHAAREVIALHARIKQRFTEATDDLSMRDLDIIADFLRRISKLAEFARS